MTHVGNRDINNVEVEIHASVQGSWSIKLAGVDGHEAYLAGDDDLTKAINKARIQIKKRDIEVHVPFKTVAGEFGVARGRHAKTRDLLVTINGKKEHMSGYGKVLKAETPTDVTDHLNELDQEGRRIDREKREIMREWSMDLSNAVNRAMDQAAKTAAGQDNNDERNK